VLELASDLTPDPSLRASRLLVAADAQLAAGALGKASALLSQASPNLLDERQRAEARRLQGVLALSKGENGHTVALLRDAARSLEPFDLRLARDTHLAALSTAMFAGRLGARGGLLETAEAARSAPKLPAGEITAADVLLDGFAALYISGPASAEPALRRGVALAQRGRALQPVGPAFQAAFELWDDEALHVLAKLRVELARSSGALIELPNALSQLGGYELVVGRFDAAEASFNEAREVAIATGNPGILGQSEVGALYLAAWRGQEAAVRALAPVCARDATARGFGTFVGFAQYAICILELGRGHYRDAMIAATDASLDSLLKTRALPEVVESAARSGEREIATQALAELVESASASGTRWGRGVLARSRALLAEGAEAEELYREAIGHLQQCRATPQLARARLVYGEWLRRSKRRRDARDELRTGLQLFQAMGAGAFADRAESELLATGERIQRRSGGTAQLLTAHERRIVALVIEGASNSEVASQLFISPRTVEYHLAKVFRKVGVTSRAELSPTLVEIPDEGGA
jgi:DNA-binding CsgD family transcriptional regulator